MSGGVACDGPDRRVVQVIYFRSVAYIGCSGGLLLSFVCIPTLPDERRFGVVGLDARYRDRSSERHRRNAEANAMKKSGGVAIRPIFACRIAGRRLIICHRHCIIYGQSHVYTD
jgi:hypothetical protein